MNLKHVLPIFLLVFSNILCMQESDLIQQNEVVEIAHILQSQRNQPKSLLEIVTRYLVKKLKRDAKSGQSSKKFLSTNSLNDDLEQLIIHHLKKYNSDLLWKIFPHKVEYFQLPIEDFEINELGLLPQDKLLIEQSSADAKEANKISLWDLNSLKCLIPHIPFPVSNLRKVMFSHDCKKIFIFDVDIKVIDAETHQLIGQISWDESPSLFKISSWLIQDSYIYVGFSTGDIKIIEINSLKEIASFKAQKTPIGHITTFKNDTIITSDCQSQIALSKFLSPGAFNRRCLTNNLNSVSFAKKSALLSKPSGSMAEIEISHLPGLLAFKKFKICPCFYMNARTSYDKKMFFLAEGKSNFLENPANHEFKGLSIIDAKSGNTIKQFNFANDFKISQFDFYQMALDNSFILFCTNQGLIVKVSLDIQDKLEDILSKISAYFKPNEISIYKNVINYLFKKK